MAGRRVDAPVPASSVTYIGEHAHEIARRADVEADLLEHGPFHARERRAERSPAASATFGASASATIIARRRRRL
jgi:hypothetical protein